MIGKYAHALYLIGAVISAVLLKLSIDSVERYWESQYLDWDLWGLPLFGALTGFFLMAALSEVLNRRRGS